MNGLYKRILKSATTCNGFLNEDYSDKMIYEAYTTANAQTKAVLDLVIYRLCGDKLGDMIEDLQEVEEEESLEQFELDEIEEEDERFDRLYDLMLDSY